MKTILTVLAISAVLVSPALSHSSNDALGAHQGFSQMDRMMNRADETTDPAERRELEQQHMTLMSAQMGMMHEMMGGHRDGPSDSPRMGPDSMEDRANRMEDRMDMMQQMMEHMFAQQEMMMRDESR
ncbi:MAG: hypothetical protein ABJ215_04810 [Alphaproteobacteria bacterium]